ncbi:MAG: hypothetical protein ACTS78_03760 [Arsenophonus sp. NC-WZS1-MAG3]
MGEDILDMYHQRCLVVHKTDNVLVLFSQRGMQRKLRQLSEVWLAEIPDAGNKIIDVFIEKLSA